MRKEEDARLGAAGRPTRWWVGLAGSGVVAQHSYTKTDPPHPSPSPASLGWPELSRLYGLGWKVSLPESPFNCGSGTIQETVVVQTVQQTFQNS